MTEGGPRPFQIVLHCHQPPGNLPEVFERAYARCYLPILEALGRHREVKVALHLSGALLEHAAHHRPELVEATRGLVERGQVELLGGGMYEPILTALDDDDARGQLDMMAGVLRKHFSVQPEGAWLTERVWDPDLPRLLAPAGLRFTYVDDVHVQASLPDGEAAHGYWVTERGGQLLALFAVDRDLRYRVPGDEPEALVAGVADAPGAGVVTYADDGEKLGLWPDTHRWVHEEGWLERFLSALDAARAAGRVITVLPSEQLAKVPPRGRVYLPSGSYEELGRWALPAAARGRFARLEAELSPRERAHLRGGTWRDFLLRYPEAGRLFGRANAVSERLRDEIAVRVAEARGQPLPSAVQDHLGAAQRSLHRAQGADPYWHGLFGGVHLPFLRRDAHAALLFADEALDAVQQGSEDWIAYEERDLDLDGELEVALTNRTLGVHVKPHEGGAIIALEDKARRLSLFDVLCRVEEPEHDDLPEHLAKEHRLDDGPRWGLVDRFLPEEAGPEVQREAAGHDLGDFARCRHRVELLRVDEADLVAAELALSRVGRVGDVKVRLDKHFRLDLEGAHLGVRYRLANLQDTLLPVRFAPELSLALGEGARLRIAPADRWVGLEGVHEVTGELAIEDPALGVRFTLDVSAPMRLVAAPVFTLCRTEAGFERIRQGFGLSLGFALSLPPGEDILVELGVDVAEAKG